MQSEGDVIASYAGNRLTAEDFRREVERLPPRARTQLAAPERKRQLVDNLIMRRLLAEEGRAKGYDQDPEIKRQVEEQTERLVIQRVMRDLQEPPDLTDDEVRAHYDKNLRLFSGAQVRASHILLKDEDTARRVREMLREDPSKFEDLAKEYSTDTATAPRGGDLGFFGQGRMVGEFERTAFALDKPGDLSDVVKTNFGYHIIKLTERKDGVDKPFDELKDRIRVTLLNQKRQEQMDTRFEELRAKAEVKVNDEALAKVVIPEAPSAHPDATGGQPARQPRPETGSRSPAALPPDASD